MANKRLNMLAEEECETLIELEDDEIDDNLKSLEDFEGLERRGAKRFKREKGESPMIQRVHLLQRQISGSSCILSPITELSHNMRGTLLEESVGAATPKSSTMRFNSLSSGSYDSSNSLDDEYMALFELEALQEEERCDSAEKLPDDLDALISGQLKAEVSLPSTPLRSVRRCLSMSQPQSDKGHQQQTATKAALTATAQSTTTPLRKSVSMNNVDILNALADEPELIGDLSKPCALPVLLNGVRHRDLKNISCDTLARLMRGEFAELSDCYTIIDCRFPYEYDGGHIIGALNLYTRLQIKAAFPTIVAQHADHCKPDKRQIYIFHCEFSSERGPKLLRFLRSADRSVHEHNYPLLDYPELYLLHNGYKEFFSSFGTLCEPQSYVPMLAPAHNEEYRIFRAKTKSWQCGGDSDGGGDSGIASATASASSSSSAETRTRILRKSRSRLLYAE